MTHRFPTDFRRSARTRLPRLDTPAMRRLLIAALAATATGTTVAQPGASTARGSVANLSITNTASMPTAAGGQPIAYTIVATNAGTNPGFNTRLTAATPAGTTFASLTSPDDWGCTTPAVGGTGPVTCTHTAFAIGSATFRLNVTVDPAPPSTIACTANVVSDITDTDPDDNTATATTATPVSLQSFRVE